MNCDCFNCGCVQQNGTGGNTVADISVSCNACVSCNSNVSGNDSVIIGNVSVHVSVGGEGLNLDFLLISYLVIGFVGVVGNSFACVVIIGHRPLRTRLANYYIISQCGLDLFVSLLLLTNMTTFTDQKISLDASGMITCYLWKSRILLLSTMASSVFNVVALTIERYFEIIHSIKHKIYFSRKIVIVSISASWVMGLVFKMCHQYPGLLITADGFCLPGGVTTPTRTSITAVSNFLGEYFIDLCIISFCYIKMGRKLLHSVGPRVPATGAETMASRARKNIMKTLLTVVVCLALTGLFKQTLALINGLGIYVVDYSGTMYKISLTFQFSNCCINPFIYMFQYKEFQKGVVVLFRLRPSLKKVASRQVIVQDQLLHI